MKKLVKEISKCALVLAFAASPVRSQSSEALDWNLSLLRGTWETHTYREKFSIAFLTDSRMIYDRQDAAYSLSRDHLSIRTEGGDVNYRYSVGDGRLDLEDDEGNVFELKREAYGTDEASCLGIYYSSYDSAGCDASISFNEDGTFTFSRGCSETGSGSSSGVYRVENSAILLAFSDTIVAQATIRTRSTDDDVLQIAFGGKLFETDRYDQPTAFDPPPQPILVLPSPCFPTLPPLPPPARGGKIGSLPSPPPEVREHRETGPTRGEPGQTATPGDSRRSSGRERQ